MRGAHIVSLEILLSYFWGIIVFIAPLLLGTLVAFYFYKDIKIWVTHQWSRSSFLKIRLAFCSPADTASNKCNVPLAFTSSNTTILDWCLSNYDSLDCLSIRNHAINNATAFGQMLTLIQGGVCILIICLIAICIYNCQRILTNEVITQSMNDTINYLLLLTICGSIGMTYYLWYINDYNIKYSWIAKFFAALSIAQGVIIPLGIFSGRMKSRILLTWLVFFVCYCCLVITSLNYYSYLALVSMTIAGFGLCFSLGLIIAKILPETFFPTA